jgi:hypothetical protein
MAMSESSRPRAVRTAVDRWVLSSTAVVATPTIANLDDGGTPFPKLHPLILCASLPAIQVAIAAFLLAETRLVSVKRYITDFLIRPFLREATGRTSSGGQDFVKRGCIMRPGCSDSSILGIGLSAQPPYLWRGLQARRIPRSGSGTESERIWPSRLDILPGSGIEAALVLGREEV